MLPKAILSVLTICFLTASAVLAQNAGLPAEPLNLDLEQDAIGDKPPGWFVPARIRDAGYTIELTEAGAHSGERCAVISREGEAKKHKRDFRRNPGYSGRPESDNGI